MRSPGEGSLYFRKSTGRWYAELITGYDAEQKRQTWRFSSKLKREALAALQQAITDKRATAPIPASERRLGDFLAEWLESVRTTRSPRTYIGYRSLVTQHIAPALGLHRLVDLRPQHIQSLLTDLSASLAPTTVLHCHRCLHRALEVALRWDLIDRNPSHRVDPPSVPKREQLWLGPEQARQFLEAARPDPCYAFWVVALTTGLRTSELAGLRWADVDGETLRVQRSLARIHGQGWIEKDTKSHQGRAVALMPEAIAALREHRRKQAEQRLAAGSRWQDHGLIFTTGKGTPPEESFLRRRHFLPILKRAGLPPMRMYDLRHSFASLMLSTGISVKVVSEMMGHSSSQQTLGTYAHVSQTMQTEAVARLRELLNG